MHDLHRAEDRPCEHDGTHGPGQNRPAATAPGVHRSLGLVRHQIVDLALLELPVIQDVSNATADLVGQRGL